MARYKYGDLMKRKRKTGPAVWQFRWTENGKRFSRLVGTVDKMPRKGDAERAVEHLRLKINAEHPLSRFRKTTMGGLVARFLAEYAPKRCRKSTMTSYRSLCKKHILPRWECVAVDRVRTVDVEDWLAELPDSRQVKAHLRSLMHNLLNVAIKWEHIERNPVDLVRQSRKRLKEPRVLAPVEFKALLAELGEPHRTMVLLAVCLGLRASELLALQWQDVDWQGGWLWIQRSTAEGEVNATKSAESEARLPIDEKLLAVLREHRARCDYRADTDFVFANASGRVRWRGIMLTDYLKPAAERAGVGWIGWHTFRHTYSTWLHALGATPAVQKELLRHADIQTTMNIYTQAPAEDKRAAAGRVAEIVWTM